VAELKTGLEDEENVGEAMANLHKVCSFRCDVFGYSVGNATSRTFAVKTSVGHC
jgi:hypothetical protein